MKNLKLLSLFGLTFIVSACGGNEIFSREYREQSTLFIVANTKSCESDEYLLVAQNPDTKQGWEMQNEYICKENALARGLKPLNNEIYTKAQLKAEAEADYHKKTLIYP